MIITASCPLRISLVGGSTDHPNFLKKYGSGKVISFPCNLRTYITIHKDTFGSNSINNNYVLNYSRREEVNHIDDIKNELIRYCFKDLKVEQINLFLTSDVYSSGSGLASSSAYLIALIKSIYLMRNHPITESEVCNKANNIERLFNPLVGQQDFYGSMGGLKKITFFYDSNPDLKYLNPSIFQQMDMYLIYTGLTRKSTNILDSIDIDKSLPLLNDVDELEKSINNCDLKLFNQIIKQSWNNKKNLSNLILQNSDLIRLDEILEQDELVLSHKLLGAGNGGFFLIFTKLNQEEKLTNKYKNIKKINISETGLKWSII
jgi:D-glycero-alpha-D-manno-heptose-7-phosphate kinase